MKIILDLNEEDIKIIHNAIAVFNRECSSAYLGLESWYMEELRKQKPSTNPFDICDLLLKQRDRAKEILIEIEKQERMNDISSSS